jgi:hypothetical protein
MHLYLSDCLADLSAPHIARLRLVSMLAVLVVGLVSGYLAGSRFGLWVKLSRLKNYRNLYFPIAVVKFPVLFFFFA